MTANDLPAPAFPIIRCTGDTRVTHGRCPWDPWVSDKLARLCVNVWRAKWPQYAYQIDGWCYMRTADDFAGVERPEYRKHQADWPIYT